jgi:Na+/melibiose symporter-like transporter
LTIKRGTLAAYAAPCLPIAAVGLPVVVYLPPYYAATLGLDLAMVGLVFAMVRFVDVPLDPLIGHLLDRTENRFGRFRPWMVAGAAIMMVGLYLVFMAAPGISPARAFAGLVVMYVGYSACTVVHTSWGSALSDDYDQRSRVFGWWQAANLLGLFLILAVPPLALWLAGSTDPAIGVHAMGWTIILTLPLAVAWAVSVLPDRARRGGDHHRLRDIITVIKVKLLRRLLLIDLLASLAPGMAGALLLFFFTAARGYPPAQASTLLLFYFLAGMLAAPAWVVVAKRHGKHRTAILALAVYALCHAGTLFLPRDNFLLAAVGLGLAGIPAVAPAFLMRAMLGDVSDAETLASGKERTGLFFAALVVAQKLGYAIPVGVSFTVLKLIGFDAALGAANSPGSITSLSLLFVIPPVIFSLLAASLLRGWPIDAAAQAHNAAALAARHLAEAQDTGAVLAPGAL